MAWYFNLLDFAWMSKVRKIHAKSIEWKTAESLKYTRYARSHITSVWAKWPVQSTAPCHTTQGVSLCHCVEISCGCWKPWHMFEESSLKETHEWLTLQCLGLHWTWLMTHRFQYRHVFWMKTRPLPGNYHRLSACPKR